MYSTHQVTKQRMSVWVQYHLVKGHIDVDHWVWANYNNVPIMNSYGYIIGSHMPPPRKKIPSSTLAFWMEDLSDYWVLFCLKSTHFLSECKFNDPWLSSNGYNSKELV